MKGGGALGFFPFFIWSVFPLTLTLSHRERGQKLPLSVGEGWGEGLIFIFIGKTDGKSRCAY
jgi:hypothetical protein